MAACQQHGRPRLGATSRWKAQRYVFLAAALTMLVQLGSSWASAWSSSPSFALLNTDRTSLQLEQLKQRKRLQPSSRSLSSSFSSSSFSSSFSSSSPSSPVSSRGRSLRSSTSTALEVAPGEGEDSKSKWRLPLPSWMRDPERRAKLTSMGAAGALSYLALKVVKHTVLSSLAWYLVGVRSGKNPIESWPIFLSLYGSLYVAAAPFQPAKLALVAAFTPVVDRGLKSLTRRLGNRRGLAIVLIIASIILVGSVVGPLAVVLASQLAGVPFPWQR